MRTAIYLRVSTDEQTTENQRLELESWAERAGHEVVDIYEDAGVSGAKGRQARPALDRLLKDGTRRKFDLVAVWSVDRLGRSLKDLLATLEEFQAARIELFLHQQGLDTSTPSGRAMFQMLGVFSEFERAMITERVKSGIARAKTRGTRSGRPLGRPKLSAAKRQRARKLFEAGAAVRAVAKEVGISIGAAAQIRSQLATH